MYLFNLFKNLKYAVSYVYLFYVCFVVRINWYLTFSQISMTNLINGDVCNQYTQGYQSTFVKKNYFRNISTNYGLSSNIVT